jgi:VIT1/CCC1 family predicted Fe2+/Mn2+ transporter
MLDADANISSITDLLTIVGSAGTVVGATIGVIVGGATWRQAFECLTLGAAAGGACGCFIAFFAYDVTRLLW